MDLIQMNNEISYSYDMRCIFKEVLLDHKFEIPDNITMNSIKFNVEKRINNIYNVATQFVEIDGDYLYILEYAGKKEIVKNSELVD